MFNKLTLVLLAVLSIFATSCATTKLSVTRMAPAKLNVEDIKSVGMYNFAATAPGFSSGAMTITKMIENKIGASQFFTLKPNLGLSTEFIMTDLIAKAGKDAGVDMMIVGVVNSYAADSKRETRKHIDEEKTGKFRTERYVENGVTKTRQVEIVIKKERFEPYLKRVASVGFIAYLIKSGQPKSLINHQFADTKTVEAEGDDKIRRLPTEQFMLSELTEKLTSEFVANIVPHEVTEQIELLGGKSANAGYKLAKAGRWDEAIEAWNSQLAANPADHLVLYDLGVAYEYSGDYQKAFEYYSRALAVKDKKAYKNACARVQNNMQQNIRLEKQMKGRLSNSKAR